jgi:hypothetical protein
MATRVGGTPNQLFAEKFEAEGVWAECKALIEEPDDERQLDLVFHFAVVENGLAESFLVTVHGEWENPLGVIGHISVIAGAYAACVGVSSLWAGIRAVRKAYWVAKQQHGAVTREALIAALWDQVPDLRGEVKRSLSTCVVDAIKAGFSL